MLCDAADEAGDAVDDVDVDGAVLGEVEGPDESDEELLPDEPALRLEVDPERESVR